MKGDLPKARFLSKCTWKRQMKDQEGVIWDIATDVTANDKVVKKLSTLTQRIMFTIQIVYSWILEVEK